MKALLISGACCVAIVLFLSLHTRFAVRREARRRLGHSERELLEELARQGIPDDIARAVAIGFRKWVAAIVPDFPVLPSDKISFYNQIVAYEFEDILEEILAASGRRWSEKSFPSLITVGDVARFVAGCEPA